MLEGLAAFALASLIIELTPGPNMAYLAVLSLERGRNAGLAAVAGIALGLLVLGLIAGFGFGSIVAGTRWIYETLRWAGVAYLAWLAWDSYREATAPAVVNDADRTLAMSFRRGLIGNLLNPKAALFYVTVLPNFVSDGGAPGQQMLVLTLAYVAVATAVHGGIAFGAGALQPMLASSRFRRIAGVVAALLLVGVAIWLAVSTHRVW
jgi:threonine/homoserine/homoserine lactone efflux protein